MMTSRDRWLTYHILYTGESTRVPLIGELHSLLAENAASGAWFFADLHETNGYEQRPFLEVAIRHTTDSPSSQMTGWLKSALQRGQATNAIEIESPVILDPAIFPFGVVPRSYITGLTVGSARAASLLRAASHNGGLPGSGVVRREIAAIYRSFLPVPEMRWQALLAEVELLDRAATGHKPAFAPACRADLEEGPSVVGPGYAGLCSTLRAEMVQASLRARRRRTGSMPNSERALAFLVGRMAHTQAIRLWLPRYPQALNEEAALLRGLARLTMARR